MLFAAPLLSSFTLPREGGDLTVAPTNGKALVVGRFDGTGRPRWLLKAGGDGTDYLRVHGLISDGGPGAIIAGHYGSPEWKTVFGVAKPTELAPWGGNRDLFMIRINSAGGLDCQNP